MTKKVLVFGANGGAGQEICHRLREDREISLVTIDQKGDVDHHLDALSEDVYEVIWALSPDAIINCIGVNWVTKVFETDVPTWLRQVNINLGAWYNILHSVAKLNNRLEVNNVERTVIAIGSNSAFTPRTHSSAYGVSKTAMLALTQNAAREFAKTGLKIYPCQIDPGFIYPTPMSSSVLDDRDLTLEQVLSRSPYGMHIKPAEIAELMCFLVYNGKPFAGNSIRLDYGEI